MIPKPIADRLDGFRGGLILILSIPWFLIGLSYLAMTTPGRNAAFAYLPTWLNENELAFVWIIAAGVLIWCAFKGKKHPKWTTAGFVAGAAPPILWVSIFIGGVITETYPEGVASALLYASYAAIIFYCAGWPNPREKYKAGGREWMP